MYVLFISNSHFVRFSHSNQALTPNIIILHKDKYKPIYPSSFLAIMMNFLNVPNQIRSKKKHSFFFFFSQFKKKNLYVIICFQGFSFFSIVFFSQKTCENGTGKLFRRSARVDVSATVSESDFSIRTILSALGYFQNYYIVDLWCVGEECMHGAYCFCFLNSLTSPSSG